MLPREGMTALDSILPTPRLVEIDTVDLALPPERAWEVTRHVDFGSLPLTRALFALRALPGKLLGHAPEKASLRIDDLVSSPEHPGFQVLHDDPPREVVVGAIGKVWQPEIPFVHVADAAAYEAFAEPGFVKVAWTIDLSPLGEHDTRVTFEVRVDATDEASWEKFRTYFRLIGPGSHFIRRSLLASLAREHGTPESKEEQRALPGDDLLPDALEQVTHGVTIAASPEAIWPWLVQMGCHRAGYYSVDTLDNGGERSAREIHPDLQHIRPGDILPATPEGEGGFEVLQVEAPHVLVLGGLYDVANESQLSFASARPERFWEATWAFVLERLDRHSTRLHVRARVAFPPSGRPHAIWIRSVHHFMQAAQLRNLAARAEGRLPRDDWHDVAEGASGAAIMAAAFLTPFLRRARAHWGLDAEVAGRAYPGDHLVPSPRWGWTHGVEIDAPAEEVWPRIAQIGADRGGFYSYQWLENIVGCDVRNAETIHPDWAVSEGGTLSLHPGMPPLRVAAISPGRWFVVCAGVDDRSRPEGKPWMATSWLFFVEPLDERRCRFVSRYRLACSDDVATRLQFGAATVEPIGFAMDRRMLMGVKARAERPAPR